jgi:hypothetical protein
MAMGSGSNPLVQAVVANPIRANVVIELHLTADQRPTGWHYLPSTSPDGVQYPSYGMGVYWSSRGVEFNLEALYDLGHDDVANQILATLDEATGKQHSAKSPAVPCSVFTNNWSVLYEKVVEPYFRFRGGTTAQESAACD